MVLGQRGPRQGSEGSRAAFGPAYERFLDFKDVVRNVYGPSSFQYRRIHVRRNDPVEPTDPANPVLPVDGGGT